MQSEQKNESLFVGLLAGPMQYHASVLQVRDDMITVLKNYSVSKEEMNCGDFVEKIRQNFSAQSLVIAMGFDDSCVGFYQFEIPTVNEKQLQAVVTSQIEIHLPLPIEQMQYSWQILSQREGKTMVAVAAAKRELLSNTVSQARQANVDAIVLNSEAIQRTVRLLGEDLQNDFSLLYLYQSSAKLFFIQNGILAKVTKFDCDFSAKAGVPEASLLSFDVQNVLAEYIANHNEPLCLYLEGPAPLVETVDRLLIEKGIETGRIDYGLDRIYGIEDSDFNMECLGLAMIARDANQQYDLFRGLYDKVNTEQKETPTRKKKILVAAVCLMLVVFIAVCYGIDKLRLAAYEKQMDTPEFRQMLETHRLRSVIAQQRIDIPDLIEKINQSIPNGVTVQSVTIQRYQRIVVGAACKEPKMMYGFAEALGKCKGIEAVRLVNQGFNDKKKLTTFTMTFDYMNFTDKRKKSL